jgi:predicted ferric reductase
MNHPFVTWNEIIGLTGGKAAWPALWNVAFVCIPIQRVSPLLQSIGVSSQQAVKVHIWAANAALLWLLVHTVLLSLVYVWDTDYNATEWLELMLPYKMYYTEGVVNFMGWVGLLSFLGLWGFSLPVVRNRFYEPFKVLHWILAACFLIGSNLHDYATFFFIQPSVVLMVADFLLRRHTRIESLASASVSVSASSTTPTIPIPTSTISSTTSTTSSLSQRQIDAESRTSTATTNTTTTTTHSAEGLAMVSSSKNGSLASLTFPIPDSWPRQMIANEPGLHVYLTIPNISRWQSHPFSISEVDTKNKTFSIHVKALGGWSETLVSTIHNNSNNNNNNNNGGVHGNTDETETAASLLSLEVEGPYSSPALYKTIRLPQKHCIFLAGGVGITGVVALAKARCRELREHFGRGGNDNDNDTDNDQSLGTPSSFTTTLLWLVQTQAEAEFLLPLLKDDNDKDGSCDGGRHSLCTHVWITRPERHETTSDNEDDDDDDDDEVEIGRRHNTILPTSTTITFRARWDFGARWNTTIVLCASLLSSVLLTMLSRWICVVQPAAEIEHEENLPYRVRECSFLGHSTNCRSCDIEDTFDLDEAYPCCTTPVCEYCFRGVPMLLSFLGMPPLTALLVRAFHAVWLRSFGAGRNLFGGYATVDNHEAFELPVTTDTLGTTNCNGNNDERAVLSGERIDTDRNGSELGRESSDEMRRRGGTIRFHVGERPKNISALLSNNYLPPGLVFHGIANPRDVLVLLCGPPNLIESTKRELVNDPLRKHWRVAMAS